MLTGIQNEDSNTNSKQHLNSIKTTLFILSVIWF